MATPLSATVGDAVLTFLQAQTYTQTIGTWTRKAIPETEIATMSGIYVTMQYVAREDEDLDRSKTLAKMTFDIALQKKMAAGYAQSDVDALICVMEDEIAPFLDGNNDFNVTYGSQTVQVISPDGPTSPVVFSPQDLREENLFTAVVRVQYQAIIPPPTASFTMSFDGGSGQYVCASTSTGRISGYAWSSSPGTAATPTASGTTVTGYKVTPGAVLSMTLTVTGPYGESSATNTLTIPG